MVDPHTLLKTLLQHENMENSNLIDIMAVTKPSRSSATSSTLNSLIRGLFTKNSQLLAALNKHNDEMADPDAVRELFKAFVNEFILWLDEAIVVFEKYYGAFPYDQDCTIFGRPLVHCTNYVDFVDGAVELVRNPFIQDRLTAFKKRLADLVSGYKEKADLTQLNNISFNNIQTFGGVSKSSEKVSSFFKTAQIFDRTKNSVLYIGNPNNAVELLLLDLSNLNHYNALAILSVPTSRNMPRSLMFPPFRVNELSISLERGLIVLKSLSFARSISMTESIVISGPETALLSDWFGKLSALFPNNLSPINLNFLIKPETAVQLSGLGIGLYDPTTMITPPPAAVEHRDKESFKELISSPSLNAAAKKLEGLTKPPSISSSSRRNSDTSVNSRISTSSLSLASLAHPPPFPKERNVSHSSVDTSESAQYERSLSIMQKTLSNSTPLDNKSHLSSTDQQLYIHSIKRNTLGAQELVDAHRRRSSQAEIAYIGQTPEGMTHMGDQDDLDESSIEGFEMEAPRPKTDVYNNKGFSSVPDLSKTKPSKEQPSTGSAIDLSNFGKSHNPSFSIPKGLSELAKEVPADLVATPPVSRKTKPRKKSLFSIFKKSLKTAETHVEDKNVKVENKDMAAQRKKADDKKAAQKAVEHKEGPKAKVTPKECLTKNVSEASVTKKQAHQSPLIKQASKLLMNSKNLSIETSTLERPERPLGSAASSTFDVSGSGSAPSAFALPSSTSTYFFKPNRANGSSTSLSTQEETLIIPQQLKDTINEDESIDFYISPSTPKAMKISKWKQKYGKWEMLTVNENLFVKIVVNYALKKSWMIIFKEELDEVENEWVDTPILLLDINEQSSIRLSSALDLQLTATNSVSREKVTVMIRSNKGGLSQEMNTNLNNVLGVLGASKRSLSKTELGDSTQTISSSMMDKPSSSTTFSSLHTELLRKDDEPTVKQPAVALEPVLGKAISLASLKSEDITNANIISNPDNTRMLLLNKMTVRLQEQMETYAQINVPSSWNILSMYSMSIYMISDIFTGKNYYNLVLENNEPESCDEAIESFSWLISADERLERTERIGKAGLLLKVSEDELFMVECRGKREFKVLYDLF